MRPVALVCVLLAAGLASGTGAAADDDVATKQSLARERAEIQRRYEGEVADCAGRFAVNACRDEARARQRQALATVQARQQQLDESQRSHRALQRQAEVGRKQAEVERRNQLAPQPEPAPADAVPLPRAAPRPPRASAQQAAAKASERAAAAQKRRQAIEADQARIDARMARRAASGKKAEPLPAPPGASGPT